MVISVAEMALYKQLLVNESMGSRTSEKLRSLIVRVTAVARGLQDATNALAIDRICMYIVRREMNGLEALVGGTFGPDCAILM